MRYEDAILALLTSGKTLKVLLGWFHMRARFVTLLLFYFVVCAMTACGNSSVGSAINQASSYSSGSEAMELSKQSKSVKVYGKDVPLPDYDDLINKPSSYEGKAFLIDGYLYDAEYVDGNDAGHYLNVWITYNYDESQGKYFMNDRDKVADSVMIRDFPRDVFESGSHTLGYCHFQVSCNLMYVDPGTDIGPEGDMPVFFYRWGKAF